MNYNFADSVRVALGRAREESVGLQHDYVGTEHILLALLSDADTVSLLERLGADPSEIRRITNESVRRGKATVHLGELPYTSRAKKVLEYSMTVARELEDDTIRTRHLLIGLILEAKGIAADVLDRVGVTLDKALNDPTTLENAAASASRDDPSFLQSVGVRLKAIRTRQESSPSVPQTRRPAQAGNRETMDRPRGLTRVRELADQLEAATRAVARAYRALEEEGPSLDSNRSRQIREGQPVGAAPELLVGLLRPFAIAGLHLGATPEELRAALERAMREAFE